MPYCPYCHIGFYSESELDEHNEDVHYLCAARYCSKVLRTELSLHQHCKDRHDDLYCVSCRRMFMSPANLEAHLNSKLHKPRNFVCPMRGCNQAFISPAAVVLHMEAGTCKSGITRNMIDRYIVEHDVRNVITNPRRMIAGPSGESIPQYTPPPKYFATERSWNGEAYECYLCNREFARLSQLNAHLASPRHSSPEQKIYKCPNAQCGMKMSTLGALCQHVESGSCGVRRFRGVQDTMDSFVNGMRRLAL